MQRGAVPLLAIVIVLPIVISELGGGAIGGKVNACDCAVRASADAIRCLCFAQCAALRSERRGAHSRGTHNGDGGAATSAASAAAKPVTVATAVAVVGPIAPTPTVAAIAGAIATGVGPYVSGGTHSQIVITGAGASSANRRLPQCIRSVRPSGDDRRGRLRL